MWYRVLFALLLWAGSVGAAEPVTLKVRMLGLFAPDRVDDLKELIKEWPEVQLTKIDFDHAEAEFRMDADKFLGKTNKVDELITRFDNKLRGASQSTFGAKPLSAVPRTQLQRVTISAAGLDCKACCLAAYEIVAKIDGVEQATASFKEGRITALLDPKRTTKAALVETLQKRGVAVGKE